MAPFTNQDGGYPQPVRGRWENDEKRAPEQNSAGEKQDRTPQRERACRVARR